MNHPIADKVRPPQLAAAFISHSQMRCGRQARRFMSSFADGYP